MPNVQHSPIKAATTVTRPCRASLDRVRHGSTSSQASSQAKDDDLIVLEDRDTVANTACEVPAAQGEDASAKSAIPTEVLALQGEATPAGSKTAKRRPRKKSNKSSTSMKRQRVEDSPQVEEDILSTTEDIEIDNDEEYQIDEISAHLTEDPAAGRQMMSNFYRKIEELKSALSIEESCPLQGSLMNFLLSANDVIGGNSRYKLTNEGQREVFRIFFKMYDKIKEVEQENATLKEQLKQKTSGRSATEDPKEQMQAPPRSFAEVMAAPKAFKPKGYEHRHIAVLETKTEGRGVDDIRKDLLKELDPRSSQIKILKTTATKNGRLLVHCDTSDDVNLLKEQLSQKPALGDISCQTLKKLNPRVLVNGVSSEIRKEDITDYIVRQNRMNVKEEDIVPRFSYAAGQHTRNWVLETTPAVFQVLMKKQRVFVGITSCRVENYVRTVRCFKCCKLGHVQVNCTEAKPKCARCNGDHIAKECKKKELCCVNCVDSNTKYKKNYNVKHSALDAKCPTDIFHRNRLLARIDFGISTA